MPTSICSSAEQILPKPPFNDFLPRRMLSIFPHLLLLQLTALHIKMVAAAQSKIKRIGKRKGATLRDVNAWRWVKACAAHLKQEGKIFVPRCAEIIKTSHGRERAPQNVDWYYIRCAAVLRAIYIRPGQGYGGLSKRFGNKKNRGSQPEITTRAARGPLHWACRSLEGLKLIAKGKEGGRVLTKEGRKKADTIAFNVRVRRFGAKKVVSKK